MLGKWTSYKIAGAILVVIVGGVLWVATDSPDTRLFVSNLLLVMLILVYVVDTYALAKNAQIQSEIMTRPVVTARLVNKGERVGDWTCPKDANFAKWIILIKNHTTQHANLKILIKYDGVIAGKTIAGQIKTGHYSGEVEWEFPAEFWMCGNFTIDELSELPRCSVDDRVYLTIHIQAKAFGSKQEYLEVPRIQYYWGKERLWIPEPSPVD